MTTKVGRRKWKHVYDYEHVASEARGKDEGVWARYLCLQSGGKKKKDVKTFV